MKNLIPKNNLFNTPLSFYELEKIADSMPDRAAAYQMMMFTMNLCHHLAGNPAEENEIAKTEGSEK